MNSIHIHLLALLGLMASSGTKTLVREISEPEGD